MLYILDTSTLIELLRQKKEAWSFIDKMSKEEIATSAVCVAEIFEGIYREAPANISLKKNIFGKLLNLLSEVIPFDTDQAEIAGKIRAELGKRGQLIDDLDILIAASALSRGAIVVTKNQKHFNLVPGLKTAAF